jgi:hypothetical protein
MRLKSVGVLTAIALFVAACSGNADQTTGTAGTPTTEPVSEPADVAAPVAASVSVGSVPANTLTAEVIVESETEISPAISVAGSGSEHSFEITERPRATSHRIPVVGMHADSDYEITVTWGADHAETATHAFSTGALPSGTPAMTVDLAEPTRMSPGYTLFDLLDQRSPAGSDGPRDPDRDLGYLYIVDDTGQVVWYHRTPRFAADARQLDNGNLLVEIDDRAGIEVNLFGETVGSWRSRQGLDVDESGRAPSEESAVFVDIDSMHHELGELPNGNLITLSTDLAVVEGFDEPLCPSDPGFDGTAHVITDVAVEFDPATGEVVREWNLLDYFDPLTTTGSDDICGLADWIFPNSLYLGDDPRAVDWTHGNAVHLVEAENTLLISSRHLDAVIGVRWLDDEAGESGDLLFKIGGNEGTALTGGEPFLHQHAPEDTAEGDVILYDNGNHRPGVDAQYSRALVFSINDDGTAEHVWEFRSTLHDNPVQAGAISDADQLENGNVLITDGMTFGAGPDATWAQLVEVVPADGPSGGEVVFRMRVHGEGPMAVYRAERLPSLSP